MQVSKWNAFICLKLALRTHTPFKKCDATPATACNTKNLQTYPPGNVAHIQTHSHTGVSIWMRPNSQEANLLHIVAAAWQPTNETHAQAGRWANTTHTTLHYLQYIHTYISIYICLWLKRPDGAQTAPNEWVSSELKWLATKKAKQSRVSISNKKLLARREVAAEAGGRCGVGGVLRFVGCWTCATQFSC